MGRWCLSSALAALCVASCGDCEDSGVVLLRPQIEVDPPAVDLGMLPVGVSSRAVVTVRNRGQVMLDLSVVRIEPEGPPFAFPSPPVRAVPPGRAQPVQVEATAPSEIGAHAVEIVIRSNDDDQPEIRIPARFEAVEPPDCDDRNACTRDFFNTDTVQCEHTFADDVPCSPADRCIVDAVCQTGVCLGRQKACTDESPCTTDVCRQTDGQCLFVPDATACDDQNPCTIDLCGETGCVHENVVNGTACDDGDACTVDDACLVGVCTGRGVADGAPCDDGDSCTVADTCRSGTCTGEPIIPAAPEGALVFEYPLTDWPERAFLHRREVSLSDRGVLYGLDHLNRPDAQGLTHVVFAMKQCGTPVYAFSYRPPDPTVLVSFVRRGLQINAGDVVRMYVGVRQRPVDGYRPQTTTYLLNERGVVVQERIQTLGGETGRSLLPDGSNIFGVIWPLTSGPPTETQPSLQNLVIVREDAFGNILWRHERTSQDWAEFLGVAGPRVLFWANGRFGALDFNTGAQVWSRPTAFITKEMALSTDLNLGVARAGQQLIGVEILEGTQVFTFPREADISYFPRTDPIISADGRILILMERRHTDGITPLELSWVELDTRGEVLAETVLPYTFPQDWGMTRHEDFQEDPYPTVADDGVAYVGYGDSFWALDPGGRIRWSRTSTVPNAYTGTVPLLRDDGVLLINEQSRRIVGLRTNGGRMSSAGWAGFRHDGARTNFTP